MTVDDLIVKMNESFNPAAAAGMDAVFQYDFKDGENFYMVVKDGAQEIAKGKHKAPSVILATDLATFIGVTDGSVNGMQAFMTGKLKAKGNMMLAQKIGALFPMS